MMSKIYVRSVFASLIDTYVKRGMSLGNFLANKWEIYTLPEISKVGSLGQGRWLVDPLNGVKRVGDVYLVDSG